ncbi:MAG: DUF1016 N-terminal domain-containing protein [Verrucomicrobiota bacterium]
MASSKPCFKLLESSDATLLVSPEYRDFIAALKSRVQAAQISAARAVNSEIILLYWDIGQGIVERQRALGWGESVVELVAADLRREFRGATGFSAQNVWRMRQFYVLHTQSDFLSQAVREIKKTGQPAPSDKVLSQHVREMVSAVPWGHHANACKGRTKSAAADMRIGTDCWSLVKRVLGAGFAAVWQPERSGGWRTAASARRGGAYRDVITGV